MQMQSVDVLTRSNKQSSKRYPDILNKTREDNFNNRYSLGEKSKMYEALNDPYTFYYFSNKAVKDHLKQLKKAIRYEPNFTEKTRLNRLINLRMKEKCEDFLCPKTSIYQKQLGGTDPKRINQKSSKSISTQKPKVLSPPDSTSVANTHTPADKEKPLTTRKPTHLLPKIKKETINQSVEEGKPEPSLSAQRQKGRKSISISKQNQQKQFADRLAEELHQKKHDKWLIFLEEKKKQLANRQALQEGNK